MCFGGYQVLAVWYANVAPSRMAADGMGYCGCLCQSAASSIKCLWNLGCSGWVVVGGSVGGMCVANNDCEALHCRVETCKVHM